jgi:Cell wall-active antibiotics response 4TMS YvqF/Domain of unknown function (DUF5668)
MEQREYRRKSLFGPTLLIGLGLLLLFNNLGWLQVDVWAMVARFWPLLLIAAGLDLLLGRRGFVGGLLALVLIGAVVLGALNFGSVESVASDQANAQTIAQSLEGASRAVIRIEAGVSQLQVSGSPTTAELIAGTVIPHRNERISTDFTLEGETAYYTLKSQGTGIFWPNFGRSAAGLWELRVQPEIPLALHVSTGVGNAKLDLDRLHLTALEVNTGVGQTLITLPGHGNFTAQIDGGVGQVLVLIPADMAARISADAGIGSVQVEGEYQQNEHLYISPDYESADERIDLTVNGGIGAITVRQIQEE